MLLLPLLLLLLLLLGAAAAAGAVVCRASSAIRRVVPPLPRVSGARHSTRGTHHPHANATPGAGVVTTPGAIAAGGVPGGALTGHPLVQARYRVTHGRALDALRPRDGASVACGSRRRRRRRRHRRHAQVQADVRHLHRAGPQLEEARGEVGGCAGGGDVRHEQG